MSREILTIAGYVLGGMLACTLIGLLIGYVVLRIQKRPWPISFSRRNRGMTSFGAYSPASEALYGAEPGDTEFAEQKMKLLTSLRELSSEVVNENKDASAVTSDILSEVEANLRVAATSWAGKLLPFQTAVWDARSSDFTLVPTGLREELGEAYADMFLANHIVWLTTEIGHQSKELEASYARLCVKIAERLAAIMPSIRNSVTWT